MEESSQEQTPQPLQYLVNETEQPKTAVVALNEDNLLTNPLLYVLEYKQVRVDSYLRNGNNSKFVAGYLELLA